MNKERKFYKKVEYHRKVGAAVASTLLVLGIASTAVYPESHSKYWDDKPEVLSYGGTLHPTYKQDLDLYVLGNNPPPPDIHDANYQSNYQDVYFKFSFDRNEAVQEDVVDKYSIIVPKTACSIVNINGTETSSGEIVSNGKVDVTKYKNYRVTYDTASNDTTTVIMKCDVDKITDKKTNKLNVSVQIKETIGEGPQFLYQEGKFNRTLSEYYKNYPLPYTGLEWTDDYLVLPEDLLTRDPNFLSNLLNDPSDTAIKLRSYLPNNFNYNQSVNDLYTIFKNIWLQYVVGDSSKYAIYKAEIINYITNPYYDSDTIKAVEELLPGFRINEYNSYDATSDTYKNIYKYELVDNLVGYARTYRYKNGANTGLVYFSSADPKVIDSAFRYYIQNYIYPSNGSEKINPNAQLLLDYIDSYKQKNISYMDKDVNGNPTNPIPGLRYVEKSRVVDNLVYMEPEITLIPDLLNYAYNTINHIIRIPFGSKGSMLDMYIYGLTSIYEDALSDSLFKTITDDENQPVYQSVLKNNRSENPKKSFNDYFVYYDKVDETNEENNKYVLINVYSDGVAYNYVDVKILPFERTSNTTISIMIDPKEYEKQDENIEDTLLEVIKSLDKHFGSTEHDSWEANIGSPSVTNPIIGDSHIEIEYDENDPDIIVSILYNVDVPLPSVTPPSGDEPGEEDAFSPVPDIPSEDHQGTEEDDVALSPAPDEGNLGNENEEISDLPVGDNETDLDTTIPDEDETIPPTEKVEKTEVDEKTNKDTSNDILNSDSDSILNNKENTKEDALKLETENNPILKPESNTDSKKQITNSDVSDKVLETESEQVLSTTSNVDIGAPPSGGVNNTIDTGIEVVPSGLTNTINNTGPGLTG